MALTLAGVALVVAAPLACPTEHAHAVGYNDRQDDDFWAERSGVNPPFSAYMILSGALAAPLLGAPADWLCYAATWSATGLTAAFAGLYLFKF